MARLLFEEKIKSRCLYRGNAVSFYYDTVRLPNGRTSVREYLLHPGAVCMVAFLDRERVLLLRQHRHAIGKTILEYPAGKLDVKEKPLICARREMLEETGFEPGRLKRVMTFWPTPAFATEIMHLYVAWNLKKVQQPSPDQDEFLELLTVKFDEVLDWIRRGRIRDAKTIIASLLIAQYGWNPYRA